jgi:hypothetical protein
MGLNQNIIPGITFCNCSVISYTSSGGLNLESSAVDFKLVEDTRNGQLFTRPLPGTFMTFNHENFDFEGIIGHYAEDRSITDYPTYTISLNDPKEILSGVPLIIGGFRGSLAGVPNVLNVFGYLENLLGFGGSNVNDSGMLWNAEFESLNLNESYSGYTINFSGIKNVGILTAVEALTQGNIQTDYGGPIIFCGTSYPVDLSGLPTASNLYRIGGTSVTLLDAVAQLCQDAGGDFYCFIQNGIIKFKFVSRLLQPQLGTIANYVQGLVDANSKMFGLELRNDVTNAVLVGGDLTYLVQETNPSGSNSIWPFFGTDITNTVIVGQGSPEGTFTFTLNCSSIADIMGTAFYPSDFIELRCALMDYDSWAAYVIGAYPDKAQAINLVGCVDNDQFNNLADIFGDVIFQRDLNDFSLNTANLIGGMNDMSTEAALNYWTQRAQRVYQFVSSYANDYYGKKFLVRVPFEIYWQYEPETTHLISSDEPTDCGYNDADISLSGPIGIDFVNEQLYLSNDGRYECFVRFSDYSNVDLSRLSPDVACVNGNGLFMKASVDTNFGVLYPPGAMFPYVVVDLAIPVYEYSPSPLGDTSDIATILNIPLDALQYAIDLRHGSFPFRIHPPAFRPDCVCLPMKSNRDTYGPWVNSTGISGKTFFEKDDSMVPWNYGSYEFMNEAANAKIVNIATGMQQAEQADFTQIGAPSVSLGDLIVQGGPNVTNIRVAIGIQGLTTQYTMRTYTPTKMAYAKSYADRFRRLGLAQQDMRKYLRNLILTQSQQQTVYNNAEIGFMQNTSRAVRQATPHDVFIGSVTKSYKLGFRTQVSTQTTQEAIGTVRSDYTPYYKSSGVMSLEGLLRPFSTHPQSGGYVDSVTGLPHYQLPNSGIVDTTCISAYDLDAFGEGNDIDIMAWGDTYPSGNSMELDPSPQQNRKDLNGLHTLKGVPDYGNARPLALKGPLTIHGWGYELTGKPIPNGAEYTGGYPIDDGSYELEDGDGTYDFEDSGSSGEYNSAITSGITQWDHTVDKWLSLGSANGGFLSGYRSEPETWPVGPVDLAWDVWRGVWAPRGIMFGTLVANMSGTVGTIQIDGFRDRMQVVDWFGAGGFASGKKIGASYWPYTNEWRILAAGC